MAGLVLAASFPSAVSAAEIPEGELSTAEIAEIVRQQAAELAAQRALIEKQQAMLESQREIIDQQQQELSAQRSTLTSLQSFTAPAPVAPATVAGEPGPEAPPAETASSAPPAAAGPAATTQPATETVATTGHKETKAEAKAKAADQRDDDPLLGYDPSKFPGAIPLPGTAAALRIGGYVKANVVQSFESIGTQDRFIVGSIPSDPAFRGDAEAALTAGQSRLNFELREDSEMGQFRAFMEGDFAGDGDTFRLRHAFGQFGPVLAGKTWSTFMDTEASPEEIDFEGINGRINTRRTQFRYFPDIGKEWNLAVAVEDPGVVVLNGDGLSQIPDIVISAKRSVTGFVFGDGEWHIKTAALYRSIRARPTANPESKDSAAGWGLSISGKTTLDLWNLNIWDERDSLMLQVNYGQGFSSYVNDLSTINVPDAAFDPLTGELSTIDAFSWYLALQHWWESTIRTNVIFSRVDVRSESFVVSDDFGDNYEDTWRISTNLIWSPWPRVDVGGELLWGQRNNLDGSNGKATQIQFSVKYLF